MKRIYISWHYTTHGVAYLKHILSAFYSGRVTISEDFISRKGIDQSQMNEVFDKEASKGFLFDKVYYLCVNEEVIQKLTDRRDKYRLHMYQRDEVVINSGIKEIWKDVIERKMSTIQEELKFVEENYSQSQLEIFKSQIWRDMQHYRISEQLWWWKNRSNARKIYHEGRFEPVFLDNITNLREERVIARTVQEWLKKIVKQHGTKTEYIINVSLGSTETQVAWFVLAEAGVLPPNIRFIKTYDDKSDQPNKRFKNFDIYEVRKSILSDIKNSLNIYESTSSSSRKLANLKMNTFIKQGFAILILGERGTGKSRLVGELKNKLEKGKVVKEVNCASFDDDTKAESELFGYEKGAFTGAEKRTDGLFQIADGGILFFDEIHHLSKVVQGKVMKALQTDANNYFKFRRMGGRTEERAKFIAIFASNLPLEKLKNILLPDLYDRIAQLIIDLPPLRATPEDRSQDWETVWKQLKFKKGKYPPPMSKELLNWLKELPLYGNYRDLQKIAIAYKSFIDLPEEAKKLENCSSPFLYAKKQFEKYFNTKENPYKNNKLLEYLFDNEVIQSNNQMDIPHKILTTRFKNVLIDFIKKEYPNKDIYTVLGLSSKKTYYNWINDLDKDLPSYE